MRYLEEVWGIRDAVENAARAIDKAISALAKMQGMCTINYMGNHI
jgi:hypothetical protein